MTKTEAGRLGGFAPHRQRGLQSATKETRDYVSRAGVKRRRLIDDLEIVPCGCNRGCEKCHDTGTVVRQETKYEE